MSRQLLDEYARLLTTDTRACANLFAPDAEYFARLGSHDLHFRGREDIRAFLQHVPRQITFRSLGTTANGGNFHGELRLSAADLVPRSQNVRYTVDRGRFLRFEVV
jgi:hypothetical protein